MWGIIALAAIAAIAVAAFQSRGSKTTVDEIGDYKGDVGPQLAQFIETVNSVNDTNDPAYVRAVKGLRQAKDKAIEEASNLLSERSDAPFAIRHSALLAVGAIREGRAIDLLSRVALNPQPLPPRDPTRGPTMRTTHGGRALEAGTILALDALDGIEALADDGNAEALDVLVQAAAVQSNAIRAVALTALAAKPDRASQLERAKATLPRVLQHLALFRRMAVQDVPQVDDPREHITGQGEGGPAAPEFDVAGAEAARPIAAEHGAPEIRRR